MSDTHDREHEFELPFMAKNSAVPVEKFPWGTLQWLCNERMSPGAEQTFGISEILPGEKNPLHYHPNCEELLYVVQGTGRQSYNDAMIDLKPGSLIRIPVGIRHNIINTGPEVLRCIIIFSTGERRTVFLE